MARSDKHEPNGSEARARVVLALLAGEITAAEAARGFGVTEQEVLLWKELYLAGARAQAAGRAAQTADGPRFAVVRGSRARRLMTAGAVLGVIGIAGAAASQSTWPISLIAFTPDTPAVASEVNANFTALKTGVEQVKTWVEDKTGPLTDGNLVLRSGGLKSDHASSRYDLWIQGSTGGDTAGDARNLALAGDTATDKLVLNVGNEYKNGVVVESAMDVQGAMNAMFGNIRGLDIGSTTFNPLVPLAVSVGGSRSLLLDDDEILVAGALPLYIQGDGTTTGTGGLTQFGGPVSMLGSLTVRGTVESGNRHVVTARYQGDYPGAGVCTSAAQIDMTVFQSLCSDVDGCSLSLTMKDYEPPSFRQDASIGPIHFEYDSTARVFRAADVPSLPGGDVSRTIGTDGNNVVEHAVRAWNCFLTDSAYTQGSAAASADSPGPAMFLANININASWHPDCVLVIDD